jgi:Acyl-CoA reductase (LuxC)
MADFKVPLIIRGRVIEDYEVEFKDRSGTNRSFLTPDVGKYIDQLVCSRGELLADLYTISLEDIYDYLEELSTRLDLDTNPYWQEAFEVSCYASNLSRNVLEDQYRTTGKILKRGSARDLVEGRIGSKYLEGWVPQKLSDGRTVHIRALGTRSVHITAGNVPVVAVGTVLRGAVTRNDVIVKSPSNDPLTASAIARTMIDMAPDHPITKHYSVAYWKGGDEKVESRIYQSRNIQKIVAWGGYDSIKYIAKYLGPGLDLITLDPKNSTTLIGKEALKDEATMREVARRVAADMGGLDQEACVNARVMYLESGTDAKGIALANRFGQMIFDAVQELPKRTSSGPRTFNGELKAELQSIMSLKDFYNVITDKDRIEKTGAVIVSQMSETVDFPMMLYGRVGNLVPLDNIEDALSYFTAATQTVGIYPPVLRKRLRDKAALRGGQMFQPVGYAIGGGMCAPQDGIEPERRMCTWVVDYDSYPDTVQAPWLEPGEKSVELETDSYYATLD